MTRTTAKHTTQGADSAQRSLSRLKRGRRAATIGAAAVIVAGLAVVGVEISGAGLSETPSSADTVKPATIGAETPDPLGAMRDLTPLVSEAINNHDVGNPFEAVRDLTPLLSEAINSHDAATPSKP